MSTPARWFDPDTELRKLRETPAKPAKVAKAGDEDLVTKTHESEETPAKAAKVVKVGSEGRPDFSGFSGFSGGASGNTHFSRPDTPEGTPPDDPTLAALAGEHAATGTFHTDGRETIPKGIAWNDGADAAPDTWLCPHCGTQASIDDVFPSLDGERTLTMWSCEPCQMVAVTPHTIRQPPTGWVKRTEQ